MNDSEIIFTGLIDLKLFTNYLKSINKVIYEPEIDIDSEKISIYSMNGDKSQIIDSNIKKDKFVTYSYKGEDLFSFIMPFGRITKGKKTTEVNLILTSLKNIPNRNEFVKIRIMKESNAFKFYIDSDTTTFFININEVSKKKQEEKVKKGSLEKIDYNSIIKFKEKKFLVKVVDLIDTISDELIIKVDKEKMELESTSLSSYFEGKCSFPFDYNEIEIIKNEDVNLIVQINYLKQVLSLKHESCTFYMKSRFPIKIISQDKDISESINFIAPIIRDPIKEEGVTNE